MAAKTRIFMGEVTVVFLCWLCMANAMTPAFPATIYAGRHSRYDYGWNLPWPDEAQFPFRVKGLRDILHMDLTVLVQEGTNATTTKTLKSRNFTGFTSFTKGIRDIVAKHFRSIDLESNIAKGAVATKNKQDNLRHQRNSLPFRIGENIKSFLDKRDLLYGREKSRAEIFEEVSPSVAHIDLELVMFEDESTAKNESKKNRDSKTGVSFVRGVSRATGFLWDRQGHVVTCYHAIRHIYEHDVVAYSLRLKFQGTPMLYAAEIVGFEREKDIAILKIKNICKNVTTMLPKPVKLGKSSGLKCGQSVHAIGSKDFYDNAITSGIVYALGRDFVVEESCLQGGIELDISTHHGFSGGPLLDDYGRVVGMHHGCNLSMKVGFEIPIDTIFRVTNQIIRFGKANAAALGLSLLKDDTNLDYATSRCMFHPGIPVVDVAPDGPAALAGIQPAERQADSSWDFIDFISAVDRKPVKKVGDLITALDAKGEGEEVELSVVRLDGSIGGYSSLVATVNVTAREKLFQHLATNTTSPYIGNCSSVYL